MNSSEIKNRICPCCGQDIVVPNEFTSLNVPAISRLWLFKLYRVMPHTVPYEAFAVNSRATLCVWASRTNVMLRDIGSEYRVENESGVGYYLNWKRRRSA